MPTPVVQAAGAGNMAYGTDTATIQSNLQIVLKVIRKMPTPVVQAAGAGITVYGTETATVIDWRLTVESEHIYNQTLARIQREEKLKKN